MIEAVLQHNLSSEEIVQIPYILNNSFISNSFPGTWQWNTSVISGTILEAFWRKTTKDLLVDNSIILLENGDFNIFFSQKNIANFDSGLKTTVYKSNASEKLKFDRLAKAIALILNAIDIIIIEDWYLYHAFEDHEPVNVIRQKLINMNLSFYEIDLKT